MCRISEVVYCLIRLRLRRAPVAIKGDDLSLEKEEQILSWLCAWFSSQLDGDWEHERGIHIQSLDNPGWVVRIPIRDMPLATKVTICLEGEPPTDANGNTGGSHWLECKIEDGVFVGAGDVGKLSAILGSFRRWIAETRSVPVPKN